ncbi:hypothetical protein ACFVS2_26695 [Brevibacillus sp. NPDC058079]|uniref:hypothetical protein n=1 Tax=Brevibacillus sp. NPDC058079 TaxID=3346330 RepID=UPI0036E72A9D
MDMNEIFYMGIKFGNGEFSNNDELTEVYIDVEFSDDSMKEFDGNVLQIRHFDQHIIIWDNKGNKLFEEAIIDIPFFREELLKKIVVVE